jgi:protein ImuA
MYAPETDPGRGALTICAPAGGSTAAAAVSPENAQCGAADTPVAWTPSHPRLAALAKQIRQRFPRQPQATPCCPTGVPDLDAALGGGLAQAAIHELVTTQDGAAVRALAFQTAAHAADPAGWILYLDTRLDLYPPGLVALGVPLGRLVVVRTPRTGDAFWVAEQALHCPAIAAVIMPTKALPTYASRRLQLAAEAGHTLGLFLRHGTGNEATFAATRLRFESLPQTAPRRLQVSFLKHRAQQPRTPLIVEFSHAADSVPAHAATADRLRPAQRRAGG